MSYDVKTFNVLKNSQTCHSRSPAGFVGVIWHTDACRPGGYKLVLEDESTSYLRAYIEGDFHAETNGPQIANRSTSHSSSATIKGYSDRYVGTCRWWPDAIKNLKIGISKEWGFDVKFDCDVHVDDDDD